MFWKVGGCDKSSLFIVIDMISVFYRIGGSRMSVKGCMISLN